MVINGMVVSYKFGPKYDMDLRFSRALRAQAGYSYDECKDYAKLTFQLLCHAVKQIQCMKNNKSDENNPYKSQRRWILDKVEEVEEWEYPDPEPGETLEDAAKKNPILVMHPLTFARYYVKEDDRIVLKLRESMDCDYRIEFFDPEDDSWIDSFLDYAEEHCKRFGRME